MDMDTDMDKDIDMDMDSCRCRCRCRCSVDIFTYLPIPIPISISNSFVGKFVHDLVSYGYWHPCGTAGTGGIHSRAVATGGHARAFCLCAIRSVAHVTAGATWASRTTSAPWAGRFGHTSVIDAAGAIYVIGGYDGNTYFNDVLKSADGGADRTRRLLPGGVPRATWVLAVGVL